MIEKKTNRGRWNEKRKKSADTLINQIKKILKKQNKRTNYKMKKCINKKMNRKIKIKKVINMTSELVNK